MAATRCKHCAGEVPLDAEMQRTLELATAALDAEEERRQHKWYRRVFAPCTKCCCKPKQAVVQQAQDGEVQLAPVGGLEDGAQPVVLSPLKQSMSMSGGSGVMQRVSSTGGQQSSVFASPRQSFTSASSSGPGCTTIDIEALAQEQYKSK